MVENSYKVRLIPITSLMYGQDPATIRASQVVFEATPTFSESVSADYSQVTPVHMPGSIMVYKNTSNRTFTIGASLISKNVGDGLANMKRLQKLRGWLRPYFGERTNTLTAANYENRARAAGGPAGQQGSMTAEERELFQRNRVINDGVQLRGAPPDVLYLYAYSTSANNMRGMGPRVNINRVPVVVTGLEITWPNDVDYIPIYDPEEGPSAYTEPFPRKMDISVSLTETHSPAEFEQFDLAAFKNGDLVGF